MEYALIAVAVMLVFAVAAAAGLFDRSRRVGRRTRVVERPVERVVEREVRREEY